MGLTTIVFGVVSLHKAIVVPFFRQPSAVVFKTQAQLDKERIEALKTKDTDHDGISDYDELYIYRTSPFLEDSDSDGIPDLVEIQNGTDPNCPQGKTCREPRTEQTAGGTAPAGQPATGTGQGSTPAGSEAPASAQAVQAFVDTFGDLDTLTPESVTAKLQTMSTDDLRTFFIKMGIPQSAVAKADDATLRKLVLDTVAQLQQANLTGGSTTPTP